MPFKKHAPDLHSNVFITLAPNDIYETSKPLSGKFYETWFRISAAGIKESFYTMCTASLLVNLFLPEEKLMHKPWPGDMSPTNISELVCVKAFFKVKESYRLRHSVI